MYSTHECFLQSELSPLSHIQFTNSALQQVAMKLFIDNIPIIVTEVMLLAPFPRMLCPKVVYKMELEMIAQIASESEEKKLEREELSRKLETLWERLGDFQKIRREDESY